MPGPIEVTGAGRLSSIVLSTRPTVGFDLDLTLLDMRAATAYALDRMNQQLGEDVDVDAVVAELGIPFRGQLGRWIPYDRLDVAVTAFGRALLDGGLGLVRPMPGAARVLRAVRARGGQLVVITGRHPKIALACLRHCGLDTLTDAVTGKVVGLDKAPPMRYYAVEAFVGDHVLDMAGAVAAGAAGIGVLTGSHTERELSGRGASAVVANLHELSEWLGRMRVERGG
jgi:phosphoglycolate phosphatase